MLKRELSLLTNLGVAGSRRNVLGGDTEKCNDPLPFLCQKSEIHPIIKVKYHPCIV